MSKSKLSLAIILSISLLISGLVVGAVADEDKYGGKLVVPETYSVHISMDPIRILPERAEDIQVIKQFMEGLVRMNHNLEVVPAIAKDWDVTENGTKYTFHLKEGVQFHKGYGEVTAEDFKYTFERLMDPEMDAAPTGLLEGVVGAQEYVNGECQEITGVKVLDDYTFQIELKDRDILFLNKLSQPALSVVPKEAVKDLGDQFSKTPVGAGPFKIVSWKGKTITLEAFRDYHAGRPYLDELVFKTIVEPGTRRAAFEAKQIDLTILTASQYVSYRENPNYELLEVPELWTRLIGFNTEWGPFKDKRVRKAIGYAINSKELVRAYSRNKAFAATGFLSKGLPAFNPDLEGYPYDPEKAKELLAEAGYPDGFKLEIIGAVGQRSWGAPLGVALEPYLKEIGIKVNVVPLESATRHQRTDTGEFEAYISSYGGVTSSVQYIGRFLGTNSRKAGNVPAYNNPEFDELIKEAQKTVDFSNRVELIREAEKIFMEELPVYPINYNKAVMAYHPWLHGLQKMSQDLSYQNYAKVWVGEESPRK